MTARTPQELKWIFESQQLGGITNTQIGEVIAVTQKMADAGWAAYAAHLRTGSDENDECLAAVYRAMERARREEVQSAIGSLGQ